MPTSIHHSRLFLNLLGAAFLQDTKHQDFRQATKQNNKTTTKVRIYGFLP